MEYAKMISEEAFEERGVNRHYHSDNTGTGFESHNHPWSHTVTCTKGSIKVTVDGVETVLTPISEVFNFPANSQHAVEILEDGTEFYTEQPIDVSEFITLSVAL